MHDYELRQLFDRTGISAVVAGFNRGIGFEVARTLLGQGASGLVNGSASEEWDQI